jgi:hypothetical protein
MPPAFKVVLVISLLVVLTGCRNSSRRDAFFLAVFAPLVITSFVWLLNAFMAEDYAMGWSWFLGGAVIFLPTAALCMIAVGFVFRWKRRAHRKENANI